MKTIFNIISNFTTMRSLNLNHNFLRAALLVLLATLGIGNAWGWGHGGACTAKLEVYKGTGSGSVYAATSSTASSGGASASADCGNSDSGTHTHTFYAFATPTDGYTFLGWTESATSTAGADASNPKAVTITSESHSTVTKTLYAHFVEKAKVNITFEAPANGTYTIKVNGGSAETVSSADVVKNNVEGVVLTATPASGYAFAGWYKLNSAGEFVEDLSIESPYDASFTTSETIKMGARFVPTTLGKFILKGSDTQYYGLKAATVAAGGSGTIVPVSDETVVDGSDLMPFDNGNYTIKAGATLLIPYSSANEVQTKPKDIAYNTSGLTTALSIYKKLITREGVSINVMSGGVLCVGGQLVSYNGGNPSAYPIGACGVLDMSNGGHIELNGTIYCWGFIKGQDMDQGNNTTEVGTITANNGSVIWEDFAVGDWRGGTACSTIAGNASSWKFFPFQSYTIQNVEVPTTYHYGATLSNYTNVYGGGGKNEGTFSLIGKSNTLFQLKDASSSVCKWYDPTTDLVNYEMRGTAQLDALNVDAGITTVSSSSYNLPLSSNMQIVLAAGCNMTLSKPMVVQPGAVVEVKSGASLTLSSNAYLFDVDNWGMYCNGRYFYSMSILTSHKNRGTGKSKDLLDDAKLIVDGTLNVTGKIYATDGGADIMGNGAGAIALSSLGGNGNIVMCTGVSTNENVAIAQANLHNEDGSYTKSIASTTFHNVNGRWFAASAKDEKANHTYDFTYISSGAVSGTGGTSSTTDALYAPDKTGLVAGMKWCNVVQDGTCSNIFNATQALNETPASDIRYTYPSSSWLQLLRTETEGVYGGSDNNLYAVDGCSVTSLGSVDENCLYTIGGVKKALVDGHFVTLEKNTEDEAWHDVANPTNYYISFAGCTWHPATKYAGEEKAYIVEEGDYIWYNNDWLLVEREDPFFFDYNDQNVKRYYEYENGAWGLAQPRVRVVDEIETRDFYKLPEAITVASGKKNTTITILKDISGINAEMTYTAKNTTCTFDLNGKTVRGSVATLLEINASGTTFTITDNSEEKTGKLENIFAQNAVTYGIKLTAGTLNFEHGIIHAENPAQYHSSSLKSCGARGIHVAATNTLNVSGGRVEAKATRAAYAIVEASSAANNTTVNITGGEIYAEAPYAAYGVLAYGKLNVSGANTITAKINTDMVDAASAADHANNKKNAEGRGIYMHIGVNKAQGSCYFGTLTYTGGTINVTNERSNNADLRNYGIYFNCDNATTDNRGGATDGSSGQKAAAKGSVKNANITVTSGTQYSVGIYVMGSYNSYDKSTHVVKIENCNINVKGYANNFGIWANAGVNTTNGGCWHGDVQADNCTVRVESTGSSSAYGAWASVAATQIYHYKDPTTEAAGTEASKYYGEYKSEAKLTINGGSYTAITKTSGAYAVGCSQRAKNTYGSKYSAEAYRTAGGQATAYATLIINGGTFNATSTTATARGVHSGGNTTINDATFNVLANSYQAYGLYAISGKITATNVVVNDTATTRASSSDNNCYAYGAMADCVDVPAGNTAQTGFTEGGEIELNNCTFNVCSKSTAYPSARGIMVNAKGKLYNIAQFKADSLNGNGKGTPWTTATYNAYYNVFPCTLQGKDSVWIGSSAKVTVNGGTYNVTANAYGAFGVYVNRAVSAYKSTIFRGEAEINDGTFNVTAAANAKKSNNCDGVLSYGTTTINGGTFNVESKNATTAENGTYAYGVYVLDGTTTINKNIDDETKPSFNVKAYGAVYSVFVSADVANATTGLTYNGNVIINGGTYNDTTTTGNSAYGVYVSMPAPRVIASGDHAGTYYSTATATINDGTFNVYSAGTTGIGVFTGRTYTSANTKPNTFSNWKYGNTTINGGTFNSSATTTAVGVYTDGEAIVNGGDFYPTGRTSDAYGIYARAGSTTVNKTNNPSFTVKAPTLVYGALVGAQPSKDLGLPYDGELIVNGGDFDVQTTSGATAYGVFVNANKRKITSTSSGYYQGQYASAGTATINDGTFYVKAVGKTASGINMVATVSYAAGAAPYEAVSATPTCTVTGGKFKVFASSAASAVVSTPLAENMPISGGYYNINTNLAKYAVSPKKVLTLRESHTLYPEDYRYTVNEGGTVTWMNGSVELGNEVYEKDEVPTYKGSTPTKEEDAQYTYTHNGWTPTIVAMENSDVSYSATFTPTLRQYDVTFNLQGHGITIPSQTKDYGSKVDKPTDPTADGWIFGGWFKEAACTNAWDFSVDEVQGTTELFAKWTMDGVGPILDIVDWTSSTLTINMNGISAAGWNYTIKVGEMESHTYAKDDRNDDRTLTVNYKDEFIIPDPDTQLRIVVTDKDNQVYSNHQYIIPHVYSSSETLNNENINDINENSILFVNSGTLTITYTEDIVRVNAIYVSPGAELKVNTDVKLKVDSLMLRTTPWKAAILDNQGTIISSKTYYTRKVADNSKYYQFAIPLSSNINNVRLSDGSKSTYNKSWILKSYEESLRAGNGPINDEDHSNWKLLTTEVGEGKDNGVIAASKGYEIFSNTPYYREYYFPVTLPSSPTTLVGVSCTKPEGKTEQWYEANSGWNALCSPLLGKYVQDFGTHPEDGLKVSELLSDGHYWQHPPAVVYPAVPFYYQAPETGILDFSGDKMTIRNAPPRQAWNTDVPTQWLQLSIQNNNGDRLDETNIYSHPEKFSVDYESGYDVVKQSKTGGKALLYTQLACGELAFAAIPDSVAETRIPVTVFAATEGDYVFSLAENNYLGRLQHVLLHDTQSGFVSDLLERDYAVNLEQGTNAGRFYIQCVFNAEAPEISTGVNHLDTENDKAQKIMYNNKVYIIYQGRVYDMTGRQCELK